MYHRKGAPKLGSLLRYHPISCTRLWYHIVVSYIRFNAYDAPSLCSVAGGTLPRFAQSLGDAPSLCSVTGGCSLTLLSHWGMLPCFTQSLGGRSLASLSRWGTPPCFAQSLGTLPCFTQLLGGCSLASLSHWRMLPRGVMPYMCHMETCRRSGYTFWPSNLRQGVFFEPDSKTGCQICKINPSQGAYSQYCLAPSHWF